MQVLRPGEDAQRSVLDRVAKQRRHCGEAHEVEAVRADVEVNQRLLWQLEAHTAHDDVVHKRRKEQAEFALHNHGVQSDIHHRLHQLVEQHPWVPGALLLPGGQNEAHFGVAAPFDVQLQAKVPVVVGYTPHAADEGGHGAQIERVEGHLGHRLRHGGVDQRLQFALQQAADHLVEMGPHAVDPVVQPPDRLVVAVLYPQRQVAEHP
mmetsp:Transcript_6036/g.15287  ORF Transcript_6036/g.15287 Transcript_6036/m.15287 type:complete len:207 (-) Transcript_6036:413-1033(-)